MGSDSSVGRATRYGLDGPVIESVLINGKRYCRAVFKQDNSLPIPVAERSKASVYGRSLAGVAGSNPAGSMDVCVVCCTVRTKGKATTIRTKYR